jgi:hypothetical protein
VEAERDDEAFRAFLADVAALLGEPPRVWESCQLNGGKASRGYRCASQRCLPNLGNARD